MCRVSSPAVSFCHTVTRLHTRVNVHIQSAIHQHRQTDRSLAISLNCSLQVLLFAVEPLVPRSKRDESKGRQLHRSTCPDSGSARAATCRTTGQVRWICVASEWPRVRLLATFDLSSPSLPFPAKLYVTTLESLDLPLLGTHLYIVLNRESGTT